MCGYCGVSGVGFTDDHVIPKGLYAPSYRGLWRPIIVDACYSCNNGMSEDETHFRNMISLAGPANEPVMSLWNGKIGRSFEQTDGGKQIRNIFENLVPVSTESGPRHAVYPDQDLRVMRVIRKIVRGLHFHKFRTPIPDNCVSAKVLIYRVPEELEIAMEYDERILEIFRSWNFNVDCDPNFKAHVWILEFFQRCKFIAWVDPVDLS